MLAGNNWLCIRWSGAVLKTTTTTPKKARNQTRPKICCSPALPLPRGALLDPVHSLQRRAPKSSRYRALLDTRQPRSADLEGAQLLQVHTKNHGQVSPTVIISIPPSF